jgi:hypothetical protein
VALLHNAIKLASKLLAYRLLSVRPLFGDPFQIIYAVRNDTECLPRGLNLQ